MSSVKSLKIFPEANLHTKLTKDFFKTAAIAKEFAESEFEKYHVIQDRLFQSDFDRLVDSIENDLG